MPSTRNPATVVNPGPGLIPTGVVTSSSIISGAGGGSEADLIAHINDPVGAHAGSAISVIDTNLTAVALSSISVKSGGVGKDAGGLDAQEAFDNIDLRLTKLRGFVATISNNVTSFGGDHNNAVLDSIVDASSGSLIQKGLLSVRPGAYKITNLATGWSARSIMVAAGGDPTAIYVDTTRVSNVVLTTGQRLENIGLGTLDNAYRYEVRKNFYLDLSTSVNGVEAGALLLNGFGSSPSPRITLKGVVATANSTITTATSCLEITDGGVIELSDCEYGPSALPTLSTITSILNIHDFTDGFNGSINIHNCQFDNNGTVAGASGLLMTDVRAPVRFTDCRFQLFGATGDSWALKATDCHSIVFENCLFSNEEGQVIRCVNSGITFIDCQFISGTGASLTNPQLICGEGYVSGTDESHKLSFVNCIATFGSANVKAGVSAPTLPIVELGGHGVAGVATAFVGLVNVDGLIIKPTGSGLGVHNYTSVVLHDHLNNRTPNRYAGVTIDMLGNVPTNTGTLGQFGGALGLVAAKGGHVLEAIGSGGTHKIQVENLIITGVGIPTVAVSRGVLGVAYADIQGFILDGTGGGAGYYTAPITQFILACEVANFQMFPTNAIAVRVVGAANYVRTTNGTRITGFRYQHHNVWDYSSGGGAVQFFQLGTDCVLKDAFCLIDTATLQMNGVSGLVQVNERSRLESSEFIAEVLLGGPFVNDNAGNGLACSITNNLFRWDNVTADGLLELEVLADFAVVMGNRILTTSIDLPTSTVSGANVIDINVLATGAPSGSPLVY